MSEVRKVVVTRGLPRVVNLKNVPGADGAAGTTTFAGLTDNPGDNANIDSSWNAPLSTTYSAGTGDLVSTNNLSDVANAATSRTNLGLGSSDNVTFANITGNQLAVGMGTLTYSGSTWSVGADQVEAGGGFKDGSATLAEGVGGNWETNTGIESTGTTLTLTTDDPTMAGVIELTAETVKAAGSLQLFDQGNLTVYSDMDGATNYERLVANVDGSGNATLTTEAGGTGTAGDIVLTPGSGTVEVNGSVDLNDKFLLQCSYMTMRAANTFYIRNNASSAKWYWDQTVMGLQSTAKIRWSATGSPNGAADIALSRDSAGVLLVEDASGGDAKLKVAGATFIGKTSSAAAPTTTEIPNDHEFAIHEDTTGPTFYLAINDGGTIRKVAMT